MTHKAKFFVRSYPLYPLTFTNENIGRYSKVEPRIFWGYESSALAMDICQAAKSEDCQDVDDQG